VRRESKGWTGSGGRDDIDLPYTCFRAILENAAGPVPVEWECRDNNGTNSLGRHPRYVHHAVDHQKPRRPDPDVEI